MKNTQETFDETMNEQTSLCLKHWNWGAFALPGIWHIFNRAWYAMILQVLVFASPIAQLSVKLVLDLAIMTYMGWQGNRITWDCAKKRMSAEDFDERQRIWNKAGIIVTVVSVGLVVVVQFFKSH